MTMIEFLNWIKEVFKEKLDWFSTIDIYIDNLGIINYLFVGRSSCGSLKGRIFPESKDLNLKVLSESFGRWCEHYSGAFGPELKFK